MIEIHGKAGDYLASSYRGTTEDMYKGKIIVHGCVGNEHHKTIARRVDWFGFSFFQIIYSNLLNLRDSVFQPLKLLNAIEARAPLNYGNG